MILDGEPSLGMIRRVPRKVGILFLPVQNIPLKISRDCQMVRIYVPLIQPLGFACPPIYVVL